MQWQQNWNKYVRRSATTTPCDGTESGGYNVCIHGAENRYVNVPGYSSCGALDATDSLGIFNWFCEDLGATVRMRTSKMKKSKGLGDMINFTTDTILGNSVTVTDGGALFTTNSLPWYTNTVTAVTGGNLAIANRIYIIKIGVITDAVRLVTGANNSAVVIQPGLSITNGNTNPCNSGTTEACLLSGEAVKFTWFEGDVFGGGSMGFGLRWVDVQFSVIRNFTARRILNALAGNGISLAKNVVTTGSSFNRFENILIAANAGPGITINNSSYNIGKNIRTFNNDSGASGYGITINSSVSNTFIQVTSFNNSDSGIRVNLNSENTNILNAMSANNGGVNYEVRSSSGVSFMNIASYNSADKGIEITTNSDSATVLNVASAGNASDAIRMNSSSQYAYYTGVVRFGAINPCEMPNAANGMADNTCTPLKASDFTAPTIGISISNDLVGGVSSNDILNPADANGFSTYASLSNSDSWFNFDTDFRGWGRNGTPFRDVCSATFDCRIYDFSLKNCSR